MSIEIREQHGNVFSLVNWRSTATKHRQELSMLPAESSFKIQILGDALVGAGIHDRDFIDCVRTDTLEQGEIGLLKTPYGLMLRVYHSDGEVIRLEPASMEYATLCLNQDEVEIVARLVKLERFFNGE